MIQIICPTCEILILYYEEPHRLGLKERTQIRIPFCRSVPGGVVALTSYTGLQVFFFIRCKARREPSTCSVEMRESELRRVSKTRLGSRVSGYYTECPSSSGRCSDIPSVVTCAATILRNSPKTCPPQGRIAQYRM